MIEKILQKNEEVINYLYFFSKVFFIVLGSFFAYLTKLEEENFHDYGLVTIALIVIYFLIELIISKSNRFYNKSFSKLIYKDFYNFFFSILILVLIASLFKITNQYSRIWLVLLIIYCSLLFTLNKFIFNYFYNYIINSNFLRKNILLIGNFADSKKLINKFIKDNKFHFRACIFMDSQKEQDYFPIQKIKLDKNIIDKINYYHISQIWIIASDTFDRNKIMYKLNTIPIDIRTIHSIDSHKDHFIENINGYEIYETSLSPFYGVNFLIKLFIDYFLAIIFLILTAPLILFFGALILIEDGRPVFFIQNRHGWDGRIIKIMKLRSLKKTRDNFQVKKNDKRILKVGKFIRRFSIDELPQFINVLKGDMSIVGPRPHLTTHNDDFSKQINGFMLRHKCKPGITGLAQINGYRGNIDNNDHLMKRYEHDMKYIKKWSPFLDIYIIAKTAATFLFHKAH